MAPKASLASLFHPKKPVKKDGMDGSPSPRKPPTAPARSRPPAKEDDEDDEGLRLPDGPYQEFKLMSSALNGWKYDVMKFDSRKPIDLSRWHQPIKLNRKELRRDEVSNGGTPEAVAPMLGPDGKPVVGPDGKIVMVDAEGRPIHHADGSFVAKDGKGKNSTPGAKKRFQKKTRQVFYVPEEVRQLRREERYPWVMEDSSPAKNELWLGHMEDVSKAETHAFFMPAANNVFKFVPAHRWYKFQKKLKHDLPTDTARVESLYTLNQKRDPQAWLASRSGRGPSSATNATFKAEPEGPSVSGGGSLVYHAGQSLGPGGRRLRTVDSGMNALFDDEDDPDAKRRREREYGEEGDLDEQVYDEDFADDEEQMEADENDEEAKELEERLKREYKAANKLRDTGVDDSEEEIQPKASKQEKAMQKLIRSREGNEAYESEEEENPYASSVEEEEEEELPVAPTEPAVQQQPQQTDSRSSSQAPKPRPQPNQTIPKTESRAASPSLGGHSVVAKRATSPKAPKPRPANVSRSNSPINSRPGSPIANGRAASPTSAAVLANHESRASSPAAPGAIQISGSKRKAPDDAAGNHGMASGGNAVPKLKKRKALQSGASSISADQVKQLLIDWLKTTPNATTRECIHHFSPYLTDSDKKTEFSGLVKEVAQLKNNVLVLKKKFQDGVASGAPSPGPAASP